MKVISRNPQPSLSRGKLDFLREIATQPTCGAVVRFDSLGVSAGCGSEEESGEQKTVSSVGLQDRGLSGQMGHSFEMKERGLGIIYIVEIEYTLIIV